jgi:hypothetical protein
LADFVDSTVRDIDARLDTLKEEVKRLEAARSALVGTRRGPGRPVGSTSGSPNGRKAGRRGRPRGRPRGRRGGSTRSNEALELVRAQPGITIPALAEAMKIQPNYLYRVMPKLVADGQIERDGEGWRPAE